jgi:parallel beta-helix repeat protein
LLMSAPPVWAQDGFYVIAGGGSVGTKITSVPYTISAPGFYYLSGNLTYSGSTNAITVNADDVTLDLMGFSLTNSGPKGSTYGVNLTGRTNVEIRNGTVRNFNFGVYDGLVNSTNGKHCAINVRAYGNTLGITLAGINNLIKGCNASNNTTTGIYLQSGLISDCVASNNVYGIKVLGPANVLGNIVFNNSGYNFDLGNGVATAIMVDRNSAFGRNPNYYVILNTEVVQWGINAGAP